MEENPGLSLIAHLFSYLSSTLVDLLATPNFKERMSPVFALKSQVRTNNCLIFEFDYEPSCGLESKPPTLLSTCVEVRDVLVLCLSKTCRLPDGSRAPTLTIIG